MKKELWETLRDPMVLIMSLGFPVFFFPLIVPSEEGVVAARVFLLLWTTE